MSFRQEERQKNNCPSRGLGLAAAAIGIGVGAAMYYFFSKRPENAHGEGSTSDWETSTLTEEEQMNILRDQAFRERPWTSEECSICFEIIRREQDVMTLPCTHHFHQSCILPWLQEQETCPNCRKRIE